MRQIVNKSISKMKKLCSIGFIPRILRDEVSLSPRILGKRRLDGLWKMAKSTDSKDRELECEKCKKLIELVFGPEKPNALLKKDEHNTEHLQMDGIQKVVPPSIAVNEKLNESDKLGTESIIPLDSTKEELEHLEKKSVEATEELNAKKERDILPLDNVLKSTTAKAHEEQLAQKMETIEEPGLVEAATPKIDGFNINPKVLGSQENILDNNNSLCTKIAPEENAMDEIAKKCLGSPPDKIDERILEEMKSCGMLERGRKTPTSRRSGYHVTKSHEKETCIETKEEHSTLYFKNQSMSNSLYDYPPMQHDNMKFAHRPQKLYPSYFKNVPIGSIESEGLDQKADEHKSKALEQKEETITQLDEKNNLIEGKTRLITADNTNIDSNFQKDPSIPDKVCNKIDSMATESNPNQVENPKEIIENVEVEVEEIRVTAAETSRLGRPGETECDPDFDSRNIKPDILPCNQILRTNEICIEEKDLFAVNGNNSVAFSDVKDPPDSKKWYRRDSLDRPFNNPNTAISGTFPQPQTDEQAAEALTDTAISARQDPAEYYDLSHCKTGKLNDDFVMNPSTMRSLAAYYQYTIITGTDEAEESQNVLFSASTPELSSPVVEHRHQAEKQELPKTINKDICDTMGPLPQLKDMEEELPLTEMLRRVRERNRLEYCREISYKALEAERAEASKCPPPLDKETRERQGKTLGPGPCKPKPKPVCPPPASPSKPKDPCAKFSKTSLIGNKIKETFSLVLQVAFSPDYALLSNATKNKLNAIEPLKLVDYKDEVYHAEKLGSFLLSSCPERKMKESGNEDVILARDYEPWSPIPSWPIPKKEKKEPFVCPKEGCKIIPPPRLNPPCKENPCINLPKRSFYLLECEHELLYLYNTDHE